MEQGADVQVLPGLRHHGFIGSDDEHHQINSADTRKLVLDESFVAGTSMKPTVVLESKARCAKPISIVMPRSFSSFRRSASIPVSALTNAVLPWSICPAVPTITCGIRVHVLKGAAVP